MPKFYVYLISLNGVPLYVGKGHGNRIRDHLSSYTLRTSKTYWGKKLRKLLSEGKVPNFEIVQSGLLEPDAFSLECELIAKYGRKDKKTGILYNGADGGQGSAGHTMSEAGKKKISQSMTGRHVGNLFRFGIPHTEESKLKISNSTIGRKESEITKQKKSEALIWQVKEQIEYAMMLVKYTWWGPHIEITYTGEVKRQSETSTHRLYNVTLNGITTKRTITDFRQGSCPKVFAHLRSMYP